MIKLGAILLFVATLAGACLAEPVAVFTPDKSTGLQIVTPTDGQWEYKILGGTKAVSLKAGGATNLYLYFKLDAEKRKELGPDVWLVVDFYDKTTGVVGGQFNGETDPYMGGPGFLLLDTRKWERALIHFPAAKLAGLQNEGADFRFSHGGPFAISKIEVYSSDPKLNLPTDKERAMKILSQTTLRQAQGADKMFYTFGGDVDEASAPLYKSLGVTSFESYVTWESCEGKSEGQWDWSRWDKEVKILQDNGLKWVPFLILGPAYSTPGWFRASKDHVPCQCLEHDTDSKVESRWNPNLPKRIDKFLSEFAKRYGKTGVIESVLLGIQGDYGEAIYSVTGGGWTFNVPGEYHNHAGYWCGDKYALASFRSAISAKYGSVDAVNKAWGTAFGSLDSVEFPGRKDDLKTFEAKVPEGDPLVRRRWLDFIDWYRDEMTSWSDWWMGTTRKHFPKAPIYLCTGGDAEPHHGSNFAEQCRVAARHDAGVRITNEASSYADNFVITRWVASAGKHYNTYYGFEPAGAENEVGIVARIYNATASGANQLHDYSPNVVSSESRLDAQRNNLKWLFHVPNPIVPVALWYPNVDLALKWGGYFQHARALRDYVDYDYVDEGMLRTGALGSHKILVIMHGAVMEKSDAQLIAEWIKTGGRVIVAGVPKFESVEATSEPEDMLFADSPDGRTIGKGEIVRVKTDEELAEKLEKAMRDLKLAIFDLQKDGIFGTQIEPNKFLFLNTGSGSAKVHIECGGKTMEPRINGGTIAEVEVK